MHPAFDLIELCRKLENKKSYRKLISLIERCAGAYGELVDLHRLKDDLSVFAHIDSAESYVRDRLGRPFSIYAIMIYCRSTESDGDGKRGVRAHNHYDEETLLKHIEIMRLRNKSVAHVGKKDHPLTKKWSSEAVVYISGVNDSEIRLANTRANYLGTIIAYIDELTEKAISIIIPEYEKRKSELYEYLTNLLNGDERLKSQLDSCPFKPEKFYDHPDGIDYFWNGNGASREKHMRPNFRFVWQPRP